MKIEVFKICIRRLMVTFNQENRKIEIMNGNSTQMLMFSDMVKRELKMEQQWHFMLNDMKINSQKQLSLKRLLKTIELLPKISSVYQRI